MITNEKKIKGGSFEYLSEQDLHKIHLASLEILERTGVLVWDEEALQLLKTAGAYVDDHRVRIPAHMVEKALSTAPARIPFCNVDSSRVIPLYRDHVCYGLGTDLPVFTDPYTGELRDTVLKDVENVAKVAQEAKNIDFVACMGLASDVDNRVVDLYHLRTIRTYCSKPNWLTATDYGNMKAIIDMAAVNAGGYDELRRRPTIGLYGEPVTPLTNSKEATQKLLLCAEYGIPVTWASGIMAGATGPVTLAGTLALGNAEGLSGLVMHQLKCPGAPFIYGNVASIMDMKTSVSCYGGPELPMMHLAVGQLGRFYDLPSYGTGGCTDSNVLDAQAGMEYMYSNLCAALAGTNLVHDNGYLGAGLIGSLESILFASETIGFINRMQEGIVINDDTLCVDLIDKIGPGGQFVDQKHTFQNFKKEDWFPDFLNRNQYQQWTIEGKQNVKERLSEKVREIIEAEHAPIISEETIAAYDEIIAKREADIQKGKFHREDFQV
ncbi:MAG: trimethylamine methyltransferase family protein [Emergencia sp.]|nr:trimethylamine methyltransferase family protein [Emergencia sp.]